jgi:hypothetical protein
VELEGLFPFGELDEFVHPCRVLHEAHGEFFVREQAGSQFNGRKPTRKVRAL